MARDESHFQNRSGEGMETPVEQHTPAAWMQAKGTTVVLAALTAKGRPARFVGGSVRDWLLGRPVKDVDIATPEPPEAVLALLDQAGIRALPTGLAHGTVTAICQGMHFEITTLRRDVETFGRHARVAFVDDWAADASRRDFTLNALFADADGNVYDYVGGLDDLRAGRVRFVGDPDTRIAEDRLRLLRFFRLHAYYGTSAPAEAALDAAARAAPQLRMLSGERIQIELLRLLRAEAALEVIQLMAARGILAHVLPEATNFDRLGRLVASGHRGADDAILRLAALLPPDTAAAKAVGHRLKLSKDDQSRLIGLVTPAYAVKIVMTEKALRRVLYHQGRERTRDLLLLALGSELKANKTRARRLLAYVDAYERPVFPLRGADIVARGVAPGPKVGTLLAWLERWWEEGDYQAREADILAKLDEILSN
jgi:poly(A) polymerase